MPTPDEELARGGIAAAWAGGDRGRRVIDRLLPALPALLAPGGSCLMVTVSENDPQGERLCFALASSVCAIFLFLPTGCFHCGLNHTPRTNTPRCNTHNTIVKSQRSSATSRRAASAAASRWRAAPTRSASRSCG